MTAATAPATYVPDADTSARRLSLHAFMALLRRDVTVLRKSLSTFIPRTIIQPFLLVFVFAYVFPQIGNGPTGAAGSAFATQLVAGVLGMTILMQGVQGVSLPLVQEFGFTREIEDRVLAPMSIGLVAFQKVVSGALQGLLAAVLIFPIAAIVPIYEVDLHINWLILLTLAPLAGIACSSLGLFFGTKFEPRNVPILFGVIILPLTFLGCSYYSWTSLEPIQWHGVSWLQYLVLVNPLVYVCEGFRAAVTTSSHMNIAAIYLALVGFSALFLWQGISGFKKRVIT